VGACSVRGVRGMCVRMRAYAGVSVRAYVCACVRGAWEATAEERFRLQRRAHQFYLGRDHEGKAPKNIHDCHVLLDDALPPGQRDGHGQRAEHVHARGARADLVVLLQRLAHQRVLREHLDDARGGRSAGEGRVAERDRRRHPDLARGAAQMGDCGRAGQGTHLTVFVRTALLEQWD
jgi:hypothetical protein